MADYEIGWGKPPKATQFTPGRSGNPKGRPPKTKPNILGDIVSGVLEGRMEYDEKGHLKKATRHEVRLRLLAKRAAAGDVGAADLLLKKRAHALRDAKRITRRVLVTDWLPDYPGQTAEQKSRDVGNDGPADPSENPDGTK